MLSAAEVAERSGLAYRTVLGAIRRGELRASRLCGRLRVRESDYEAWVLANRVIPTQEPEVPPPAPRQAGVGKIPA